MAGRGFEPYPSYKRELKSIPRSLPNGTTHDRTVLAHHRGIDIKPSNIAINERGIVKVLDFGLAKHVLVWSSVAAQAAQFNSNIPPRSNRSHLKALAKKPDARYQTAADLISDLQTTYTDIQKRGSDQTVTRLLSLESITPPSSALATLSDILKRPRLSIGHVAGALMIL